MPNPSPQRIAEVAAGLPEAQRAAVIYLPAKGWTTGPASWHHSNVIKALSMRWSPLAKSRPSKRRTQVHGPILQWSLTPLGLAVRQQIEKEEG